MKKHKHISDTILDKYLDKHNLDLEINLLTPQGSIKVCSNIIITCRLTGEPLLSEIKEGIFDDKDIINLIKPIIRNRTINQLIK